jgi:hypothetical protein
MKDVRVCVHIDAPLERVFDAVSDHERFLHSEGDGTTARVVRPGVPAPNGLGCLREVTVGDRASYLEEITGWQRPMSFEYTIRQTSLPLRHLGSRLAFTSRGAGTDVEWTSRFEITVPILGPLLGSVAARRFARGFTSLLLAAKGRLEAQG